MSACYHNLSKNFLSFVNIRAVYYLIQFQHNIISQQNIIFEEVIELMQQKQLEYQLEPKIKEFSNILCKFELIIFYS